MSADPKSERTLRPAAEIARRLCALDAVVTWVTTSEEENPSESILAYLDDNDLDVAADDEGIFELERADADTQHRASIGWRLENMWPLAWILGFPQAPTVTGMADGGVIQPLFQFLPEQSADVAAWVKKAKVRAAADVVALEAAFAAAYAKTPNDGVVHERRHSLLWALSPGVDWDEIDLASG